MTEGRVVRTRLDPDARRCLALWGKGPPGGEDLDEAMRAVARTALALRELGHARRHEEKLGAPGLRVLAPAPGARGGEGWVVSLPVPGWVTLRDAQRAIRAAAERTALAKGVRLVPEAAAAPAAVAPGRDHQPAALRKRTAGAPQHRAREATPRRP
jgi:hypothetical protein